MNTFNTAEYFNIRGLNFNNNASQEFAVGKPKKWLLPGADASEADEEAQDPTYMVMMEMAEAATKHKDEGPTEMDEIPLSDAGYGLKTAFEQYYAGNHLTDAEIDAIIWFTSQYADFGWVLPERFALFIAALKEANADCSKIQLIRKERQKGKNEGHGDAAVP